MNLACWATSNLTVDTSFLASLTCLSLSVAACGTSIFNGNDTVASVHARLLTLAGLTATCIAHSVHSKISAEADF